MDEVPDELSQNTCSHLHSKPQGQVHVELGGWLESALRAMTVSLWVLTWLGSLSWRVEGGGWKALDHQTLAFHSRLSGI